MAYGRYRFAIADAAGVAAANRFLAIFNPAGSTVTVRITKYVVRSYAVAATIALVSILANRITASSGGTLATAANIMPFATAYGDPSAEIRTANPTVTVPTAEGLEFDAMPPPVVITAAGGYASSEMKFEAKSREEEIILAAGEGIVFRTTAAGDTDQNFDIVVEWVEIST